MVKTKNTKKSVQKEDNMFSDSEKDILDDESIKKSVKASSSDSDDFQEVE